MEANQNAAIGTYLEDDVSREDMLNASHNVFCLALCERLWFAATAKHRSVGGELGYFCKLLDVGGLNLRGSGRNDCTCSCLRWRECVHCF
jgi:hypothetical protein